MSRAACEKITTFVLELQVLSGFSTCVLALLNEKIDTSSFPSTIKFQKLNVQVQRNCYC